MKNIIIGLIVISSVLIANESSDKIMTKLAKKLGYTTCLPTVKDLENYFTKNNSYGVSVVVSKNTPNSDIFVATMEISYKDSADIVDIAVVHNPQNNTCSFSYTKTWLSKKSCLILSNQLKKFEYKGELNKFVSTFSNGKGVKILLMPVNDGCMVQKKEIAYDYKKVDIKY